MIPKIIHYIWIGGEMSLLHRECLASWETYAPEFKIIYWNEDRIEKMLSLDNFYYQMIKKGKYAFAVDYLRCKIIYEYGGIYLDTDMELVKDITPLCANILFSGYEKEGLVSCGIIGAVKEHTLINDLMNRVISDGGLNVMPEIFTGALLKYREKYPLDDIKIYPIDFFYPFNPYREDEVGQLMLKHITDNTYAIHHWTKTWKLSFWELVVRRLKKCGQVLNEIRITS